MVKVSIVIPVKNNARLLEKCLASIQDLNFPKNEFEVIVVDGGSTDGSVEVAKRIGCRVIAEDRGVISYARDLGVKYASGEFIAFTDSDCIVEKNWLMELLKHFNDESIAAVGGPNLTPEDDTEFAKCVGDVLSFLSKLGARYGLNDRAVREIYHNPTCNVMYRRKVLEEVGGFNVNLITADDEELDYRIRSRGYKILYTPYAIVYHYRRRDWRSFMKMAYNYGLGRIQAIKLHRQLGKWFHFVPSTVILLIFLLLMLSLISSVYLITVLFILAMGGAGTIIIGLHLRNNKKRGLLTYVWLIMIWFLGYGIGMLRGVIK
ncbi:MAG: glycosyltransferase [Nitrososphaerota archaeon]